MITIQTAKGSATVETVWQGSALAVHRPYRADGSVKRGCWAISHAGSGYLAGILHRSQRDAIKLARLWDTAFEPVTLETVKAWPLRDQWIAIVRGDQPLHAPLHGPMPSPNHHPARPEAVRFALDAGRRVRNVAGLFQTFWRGQWWELPTMAELKFWTFDSCCETPDGRTVEPDAPDSWLSLLGLV